MGHREHLRLATGPRPRQLHNRRQTVGKERPAAPRSLHFRDRERTEHKELPAQEKVATRVDRHTREWLQRSIPLQGGQTRHGVGAAVVGRHRPAPAQGEFLNKQGGWQGVAQADD